MSGTRSAARPSRPWQTPVTVVIPTLNEAPNIADCIRHLEWAAEIIVADAGSGDNTVRLAHGAGARVLEHTGPTIAAQRNAAIAAARYHWIFALDADERIPSALAAELAAVIAAPYHSAYRVRRRNIHLGREVTRGRWGRDWVTRLFPRDRRYLERRVHERLEPVPDTGDLHEALCHTPYRDLAHHLGKMRRYARWGAEDLYDRGRHASVWDVSARPLARFVRAYLAERAILDGLPGLTSSALGAYGTFLKYTYLRSLERRPSAAGQRTPDGRH